MKESRMQKMIEILTAVCEIYNSSIRHSAYGGGIELVQQGTETLESVRVIS